MVPRRFRRTSAMGARARRVVRRRPVVVRSSHGPVYGWVPLGWREPFVPSVESLRPTAATRATTGRTPSASPSAGTRRRRIMRTGVSPADHRRFRCSVDGRRSVAGQSRCRSARMPDSRRRCSLGLRRSSPTRPFGRPCGPPAASGAQHRRSKRRGWLDDRTDRSQALAPVAPAGTASRGAPGARRAAGWLSLPAQVPRAGATAPAVAPGGSSPAVAAEPRAPLRIDDGHVVLPPTSRPGAAGGRRGAGSPPASERALRTVPPRTARWPYRRRCRNPLRLRACRTRCPQPVAAPRSLPTVPPVSSPVPPVAVPVPVPQPVAPASSQRGAPVRPAPPNPGPNDRPNWGLLTGRSPCQPAAGRSVRNQRQPASFVQRLHAIAFAELRLVESCV